MNQDQRETYNTRRRLASVIISKYNLPASVHPRGICISENDYSALRAAVLSDPMNGEAARFVLLGSEPFIITHDWAHEPFTVATLRLRATIRAGLRKVRRAARGRSC